MLTVGVLALAVLLTACRDDAAGGAGLCTETMVAGQAAECVCEGDAPGVQACQDDGTLTACSCGSLAERNSGDGDAPAGDGGRSGDGDAPMDGGVGTGPGDPGDGDGDGDGDSGDGDGDRPPFTAPTDGGQLAFCYDPGDCNDGLSCYAFGHYCSGLCLADADCGALGERYSCFGAFPDAPGFPGGEPEPIPGICRIECREMADSSCPRGMICVSSGGGFSGSEPGFRCVYTEEAGPVGTHDTPIFGDCNVDGDCSAGLRCSGGLGLRGLPGYGGGYCVQPCLEGADCTEQPQSGTATAECLALGRFPGEEVGGSCSLDCGADLEGCPKGMECIVLGFGDGVTFAVCDYPPG